MKLRGLLFTGMAVVFVVAFTSVYLYHEAHRPKRVWVSYLEKFDGDEQDKNDTVFAEARLGWLISHDKGCMVLTHDKKRADYAVNISVIRGIASEIFGKASLSITKSNGDVVTAEDFYQDRKSTEDIGMQPITKTWEVLCQK
jgi:hypothetical protein